MNDPKIQFGNKVREIRLEKEWSQEELGYQSGLDRTYIGSVENGKRNISLINICKIAKALNIAPKDLLDF